MDAALTAADSKTKDTSQSHPAPLVGGNMTVLDVIDRTFRIYRKNFIPFVTITAIIALPLALVNVPLTIAQLRDPNSGLAAGLGLLGGSVGLATSLVQIIVLQPIVTYMASEMHFGNRITVRSAFRDIRNRMGQVGVAYLLFGLLVGAVAFVGFFAGIFTVGILAIPVFIFLFYYATSVNLFLLPMVALEDIEPMKAVSRAYKLGRQRFWRGLGLGLLISMITVTQTITLIALSQLSLLPMESAGLTNIVVLVSVVAENLVAIFTTPISIIALVVFYYDSRVRLEGLDVSFYLSRYDNPRPSQVPSPTISGGFITGRDVINMLILLGGIAAVIGVAFGIGYGAATLLNL
ncbi:MAG: hypothetical protein AAF653_08880 [Chloroflexota bacterium]